MKTTSARFLAIVSLIITVVTSGMPLAGRAASEVVAWGGNECGQTDVPDGLSNVVAIAAGDTHGLALMADGRLVAWGGIGFGLPDCGQAQVPSGLSNVVAIAAGGYHNLALTADGRVTAWGAGSTDSGSWPDCGQTQVPSGLSNVVAIAAGDAHSLALTADGRVMAWGDDYIRGFWGPFWSGQAVVPRGLSNVVAIAAGAWHSLALTAEGRVVAWGLGQSSVPISLSNVVAISAAAGHDLALTAEGRVFAWGGNGYGQTNVPSGLSNVVAIVAEDCRSLALTADGRVVLWGTEEPTNAPSGLSDAVAIAAGDYHDLALTGLPPGLAAPALVGSPFLVATTERPFHYRIIAKNGVSAYGASGLPTGLGLDSETGLITGQPSEVGTFSIVLSATNTLGSTARTVTLYVNEPAAPSIASSGVLLPVLGAEFNYPVVAYNSPEWYGATGLPPGLVIDAQSGVVSGVPTAFGDYAVSLTASNRYGVGTGSVTIRVAPVVEDPSFRLDVPNGLSNVVAITAGLDHRLALTAAGRVVAWGNSIHGQHGQSDIPDALSNVVAIAAGEFHNLALTSEGRVVAWGAGLTNAGSYPDYGQSQVPVGLSNAVAIAAEMHSLALQADGTVVAWGWNDYAEADVPSGLSNVVAIAAGAVHSLALTADGRVVAWGRKEGGVTDVPNWLSNVVAIAASGVHSLALTSDGMVVGWGNGDPSIMPGGWGSVVAIAAGPYVGGWALTSDGRMLSWDGGANVSAVLSNIAAIATGHHEGWLALLRQPTVPTPRLELFRETSGLALQAHGAPGISCQLLRASHLTGPWLPAQPVTFTNNVQFLRAPDTSQPAQFFRLLRK
jgi:alpha-tubulin suppressor-like RCC1 family protein